MYKAKVYYENEDFKISLEDLDDNVFVHVAFTNFSKSIHLAALKVWAEFKAKLYWMGYEEVFAYTKDKRMKRMFPGSELAGQYNNKGQDYEVLRWVLK